MPDEPNIQRIKEYLEQHRSQYTLPELRAQLAAAGYAPEDIDAAIAQLGATPVVVAPPPPATSEQPAPVEQPAQPISPDSSDDTHAEIKRMVGYLRQNAAQYSVEALRDQLLASGRSAALVDAALERFRAEQPVKKQAAWPAGLAVAMLNLVILPLVLSIIYGVLPYSAGVLFLWIWPLALVGEIVAGLILRTSNREHIGRILLYAVLFTIAIPIALGILLFGICLVLVGVGALR